ncbi:MAG: lipoyl(octanoyl) transferase LipB [Thermodesulfobacteriota bacterium]
MGSSQEKSPRVLLLDLPQTDYESSIRIQRAILQQRLRSSGEDVVILLEHPPTITLGVRADESDLLLSPDELTARGIDVCRSDRGGQATYHGPGQLVCYPLLDLRRHGLSVRDYVTRLEETILCIVSSFGVTGFRVKGKPGVWTPTGRKIASIGVRVQRRVTSHGFSLNVNVPLEPASFMVSCGDPNTRLANLRELAQRDVEMAAVRAAAASCLARVLGVRLHPVSLNTILGLDWEAV